LNNGSPLLVPTVYHIAGPAGENLAPATECIDGMIRAARRVKKAVVEKRSKARHAGRTGRPPRERSGEVDARILDAARRVFLKRGLAGASMDEIASLAGAGKPTIYARFAGKKALFAAVVSCNVDASVARLDDHTPVGANSEDRLVSLATRRLHWALEGETVDLMRLGIAEARRFPELASNVKQMARQRGEETVARLLCEAIQFEGAARLPAFTPERLPTTTRFFIDLAFLPLMMRALFGEKRELLRAQIGAHVVCSVAFFLAACRDDSVD
jgi:AcrR family transcriptional regulator